VCVEERLRGAFAVIHTEIDTYMHKKKYERRKRSDVVKCDQGKGGSYEFSIYRIFLDFQTDAHPQRPQYSNNNFHDFTRFHSCSTDNDIAVYVIFSGLPMAMSYRNTRL